MQVDLENGPYEVHSKALNETIYLARDQLQAEKCRGVTYTKKDLEYIQKTPKPNNTLKVMHLLKKRGYEVCHDPWPQSSDTLRWLVLLSLVQNDQLRQALFLLRKARAAYTATNPTKECINIRSMGDEASREMYEDMREYMRQNSELLMEALHKVYLFFEVKNKNKAANNTAA